MTKIRYKVRTRTTRDGQKYFEVTSNQPGWAGGQGTQKIYQTDKLVDFLRRNPTSRFSIEGQADRLGSDYLAPSKYSAARINSLERSIAPSGSRSSRAGSSGGYRQPSRFVQGESGGDAGFFTSRGTPAGPAGVPGPSADAGQCIAPDRKDFQSVDLTGRPTGGTNTRDYNQAIMDYQACLEGTGGGGGGSGPTTVDYMSSVIDSINAQISANRLKSDQAIAEFNRDMDAFREGGSQFQGLQQYTIPTGAQYMPGLEPGGFGSGIGLGPVAASPINYNPFEAAFNMVRSNPSVSAIGAPDVSQIVKMAQSFLG